MVTGTARERQIFLSTLPAGREQRRLALALAVSSIVIFIAAAPFAKLPLAEVPAFLPIYQSALVINDLITALLLFGQFRILRSRALLVLASGYLFSACMAVSHALSFPGMFAPTGLLGAGPQTTAWIYFLWHGAFPLFVIAYALLKGEVRPFDRTAGSVRNPILFAIAAAFLTACGLTLVTTAGHDALPAIMQGDVDARSKVIVASGTWILSLLALAVLWWRRPHSVLDLWIMAAVYVSIFDIALAAVLNHGRYDLGWYAGRVYGLLAASFVLAVLLLENGMLHARLLTVNLREGAILDNLHDCVITIDSRGVVRNANPAVERVLGYTTTEIINRNVSMLMPEPHRSSHDAYLERYMRTGEARIIGNGREVEGRHKSGQLIPLELGITEYAVHGERFFIGTLHDIRERRRLIAELTKAREDAEEANRAKSAFLATMSHEIRTPMNGVVGMVEVLARSNLNESQADAVKTIRSSAFALLGLIDDILDFSKIEAGRLELERVPVSVAGIVEGICSSLAPVAADKRVDIALFIDPRIPVQVWSDQIRLRQVLYNLLGNAIKFSGSRPGKRGRVAVRVNVLDDAPMRLAFSIADNGIGMAPESVTNLFTSFSQAEVSTTRRFGGSGLGLAISKRLVDLMQGEITVESTLGVGSVFTVTLPIEMAKEQPADSKQVLSGVDCVVVASPGRNEEDLRTYLEHAGARVQIAPDLNAAAEQVAGLDLPVVIQDIGQSNVPHSIAVLQSAFAAAPNTRYVVITRGVPQRARLESTNAVTMDGNLMRRQTLLRSVAVAAGRASPEVFYENAEQDSTSVEVIPPTIAEARAQGRLILVAEDDAINQKVILRQLNLLGYAAEIASNGAHALRLWREGKYAVLLTDLHMPEMDGYALVEAIRREEARRGGAARRIPILALTANALRGEATRARAIGMDEYLTKPLQLHLLGAALEKWLPLAQAKTIADVPPAEHRGGSEAPLLDVAVLQSMVGDDATVVREFLTDYLVSARRYAMELRTAHAAGNAQYVGAVAHKLKSSSRSVGAIALGELCDQIEEACGAGSSAAIARAMAQFDAAMAAVEVKINELVA